MASVHILHKLLIIIFQKTWIYLCSLFLPFFVMKFLKRPLGTAVTLSCQDIFGFQLPRGFHLRLNVVEYAHIICRSAAPGMLKGTRKTTKIHMLGNNRSLSYTDRAWAFVNHLAWAASEKLRQIWGKGKRRSISNYGLGSRFSVYSRKWIGYAKEMLYWI